MSTWPGCPRATPNQSDAPALLCCLFRDGPPCVCGTSPTAGCARCWTVTAGGPLALPGRESRKACRGSPCRKVINRCVSPQIGSRMCSRATCVVFGSTSGNLDVASPGGLTPDSVGDRRPLARGPGSAAPRARRPGARAAPAPAPRPVCVVRCGGNEQRRSGSTRNGTDARPRRVCIFRIQARARRGATKRVV